MYSDLELLIRRWDEESYAVDLRFTSQDTEERPLSGEDGKIKIPFDKLLGSKTPQEYGRLLSESVFSGKIKAEFQTLRKVSESRPGSSGIRVRLLIDSSAKELQDIRWEAIADPDGSGRPLCTNERIAFSRYLTSIDPRPVRSRPRRSLTALVVVASPSDLSKKYQQFPPIDVAAQLQSAREALGDRISIKTLAGPGDATLTRITAELRTGCDILYLVCHGSLSKDGVSRIYIETEDQPGTTLGLLGEDFVRAIQGLLERPRLIVLASCESAAPGGDSGKSFMKALGPRLAEVGVPSVVAMGSTVSMEMAAKFMRTFFGALNDEHSPCAGQIDHAMTVARQSVATNKDFWVPILFLRLKSGTLWYTPGFVGAELGDGYERWPAILGAIRDGECTVVAGCGLGNTLFGERSALANRIAEEYGFPLSKHEQDDLEQVAQYVAVAQGVKELRRALGRHLLAQCLSRHKSALPEQIQSLNPAKARTEELFGALQTVVQHVQGDTHKALVAEYRILARLPVSLYISTDPSDLLVKALQKAGRSPRRILCPWNKYTERLAARDKVEIGYQPTPDKPLVFQLFGILQEPKSLLLTVDDYFDYLIGITSNKILIPTVVRSALADKLLLFAGIRVEDWDFKVLLRTIVRQEGNQSQRDGDERNGESNDGAVVRGVHDEDEEDEEPIQHIAAQVTPEEGRIGQPKKAREYLQAYLRQAQINIYWGDSRDFLSDLISRWIEKYGQDDLYGDPDHAQ